jgi:hypothetical protein
MFCFMLKKQETQTRESAHHLHVSQQAIERSTYSQETYIFSLHTTKSACSF